MCYIPGWSVEEIYICSCLKIEETRLFIADYSVSHSQIDKLCFRLINMEDGFFIKTKSLSCFEPRSEKNQWKAFKFSNI